MLAVLPLPAERAVERMEFRMDEARRFLRYVVPGIVFLVESFLLIWVLLPDWAEEQIRVVRKERGLGLALLTPA
jgi:hypothetical protein